MRTIFCAILLACAASAEPRMREDQYDMYDVASIKAGEWVETADVNEHAKPDGTKDVMKHFSKEACVKADDEFVWIEETKWSAEKPEEKEVTLAQVRRADRKTVKGWWGKSGGAATELKLNPPRGKRPPSDETKSTGTVSTEKVKNGDKEVDAQKLVVTMVEKRGDKTSTTTFTIWMSAEAPMKVRVQDASVREVMFGPVKWEKDPTGPVGLVKAEIKAEDWTSTTAISGSGTDAKPTLTVK
jgi:hypothetical protein